MNIPLLPEVRTAIADIKKEKRKLTIQFKKRKPTR